MPAQQEELAWLSNTSAWDELPLAELHSKAATVQKNQDVVRARSQPSKSDSDLLSNALSLCRTLVTAVERAGLFSGNEEADDLSTSVLKYLLAPYYLAELLASMPGLGSPSGRAQLVTDAVQHYTAFLQRCQQYDLLGSLGKRLYTQEEDTGGQLDVNSRRAAKIERFKADKQIRAQLAVFEQQKAASGAKADDQDDSESVPLGGARGWDEEDERRLWLAAVQQAALNALGQREMLREELKLLEHAVKAEADAGQRGDVRVSAREEIEQQQREEVLEQLRKIAVNLGSSMGTKKQQLQAQVFQPGHLMPTRTLAEQADIEIAEARQREQAEHSARAAEARRLEALGNEEDEEALKKQRAWDDWADANPKGWGNSKTKPCG